MRRWLSDVCVRAALILTIGVFIVPVSATRAAAQHAEEGIHDPLSGEAAADQPGPMTAEKNDVDLALWTLITFVVFLIVLKKFAWSPLIAGLDRRESGVLDNIAAAEAARLKAEKMLAEHAAKLDKVQDEVREIVAEARRDAEYTKNDIIATAQKEAEATRQRAVQDIERARDQAMDELFAHMGRVVSEATEQVIGRALTGADNDRLIDEALSGFAQRKH